jgi:hypothetical protein
MLAEVEVARLRERSARPAFVSGLVVLGVLVDNIPTPFPLVSLERPAIYATLREQPEPGTVCELPLGTQDGFGMMGLLNQRVLFYQTIHERPIVGGLVARLPASVRAGYENDLVLNALLRLSDLRPMEAVTFALPSRQQTIESLQAKHVAFVVLDRDVATRELQTFVEGLRLPEVARDRRRTLYRVTNVP